MNNTIMGIILSIVAGIMIQIATYELIPTSLKYKNKKQTIIYILIGIIFMFLNHLIIK